jgi:hypothetical protein
MSSVVRLSQARRDALADIVDDLSDEEISEALGSLTNGRILEIARTSPRAGALVARGVLQWPVGTGDGLLDLWRMLLENGDRGGVDALAQTIPVGDLLAVLALGCPWDISWETLDARSGDMSDLEWMSLVRVEKRHTPQFIGAAVSRGELGRASLVLDSNDFDGESLLAYLVSTRPIDIWMSSRLEGCFDKLLARFGRFNNGRVELLMGEPASSEAARALALSHHPGLRRVAARSAQSDSIVRALLLEDGDPSIDGALCSAPLNASEIGLLMERLRSRDVVPREAENLLFQPEPLSTKDRLWLLRSGHSELTRSWIAGLSAQNPRSGEVALLLKSPGSALSDKSGSTLDSDTLLSWARDTGWIDELERSLHSVSAATS